MDFPIHSATGDLHGLRRGRHGRVAGGPTLAMAALRAADSGAQGRFFASWENHSEYYGYEMDMKIYDNY